jgi:DNA-binding IclR family transcriptional regulator
MADKAEMVLDAMKSAGKPVRPGDVADATGIPKDEVAKIIQTLKKEGRVVSPKRCFWEPAG